MIGIYAHWHKTQVSVEIRIAARHLTTDSSGFDG